MLDVIEASEPRRSVLFFGASGMAGTVLSPKTLWLCDEYFWWNGEGMMNIVVEDVCNICVDEVC